MQLPMVLKEDTVMRHPLDAFCYSPGPLCASPREELVAEIAVSRDLAQHCRGAVELLWDTCW